MRVRSSGQLLVLALVAPACSAVLGLDDFEDQRDTHVGGAGGQTTTATSSGGASGGGGSSTDCPAGTKDCGGVAGDCETQIATDEDNCGDCGALCVPTNASAATCANGSCELTCEPGFLDCNHAGYDGCEVPPDDQANCGSCNHACSGACVGGKCQIVVLANGLEGPTSLAVDATNVYWSMLSGAIMKVPVAGGVATTLATGELGARSIALSPLEVFWSTDSYSIHKATIGTGMLDSLFYGPPSTTHIAVGANAVFWTAYEGMVMRVSQSGANVSTIVEGLQGPAGIGIDDTHVYWTCVLSGQVSKASHAGANVVDLYVLAGSEPKELVVDATDVYWVASNDGTGSSAIMRVSKGGVGAGPVAPVVDPKSVNLTVDDAFVYWTDGVTGAVLKAPKQGGAPVVLADGQDGPGGVAVDATRVYWANYAAGQPGGAILAIEKSP